MLGMPRAPRVCRDVLALLAFSLDGSAHTDVVGTPKGSSCSQKHHLALPGLPHPGIVFEAGLKSLQWC